MIAVIAMSPDCEQGKHQACDEAAWDHDADEPTPCRCNCHGDEDGPITHTIDEGTVQRAVAAIDALPANGGDTAHDTAESILLDLAPDAVEEAFERAAVRCWVIQP